MDDTKQDGGPAFAGQPAYRMPDGTEMVVAQQGMSLRDYFAAAAMTGILARNGGWGYVDVARDAYGHADAMLEERNRQP